MLRRPNVAGVVAIVVMLTFGVFPGLVQAPAFDPPNPPTVVADALEGTDEMNPVEPEYPVHFVSTGSDPDLDLTWYFGDGESSTEANPMHTFGMDGVIDVTLVGQAPNGAMALDTVRVWVKSPGFGSGGVPGAIIVTTPDPPSVFEDVAIFFDGTTSWPLSYPRFLLTYAWDFGDGATSTLGLAAHGYGYAGVYTVRLTVGDATGNADTTTVDVTILNEPPVAAFSFSPTSPATDATVTFDASASSDKATDDPIPPNPLPPTYVHPLTFAWDFGDGYTGSGRTASHAYASPGLYTATLTVRDDNGATTTTSLDVTVANVVPTANAGNDLTVKEAQTVLLDGTGSSDSPSDLDALDYAWTGTVSLTGSRPTYVWYDETTATFDLRVTDPSPATSAPDSISVTVQNRAPYASIVDVSKSGPPHYLSGVAHEVGADSLKLTWNFGDGDTAELVFTNTNGASPFHAEWEVTHDYPGGQGPWTTTLIADDLDGLTDTATALVYGGGSLDNKAPEVTAVNVDQASRVEDETFTFTAAYTDDGSSPYSFLWDFGDGDTATTSSASKTHAYAREGAYTVIVKVTDAAGDWGANSRQVTVTNSAPTAAFTYSPTQVWEDNNVQFDGAPSTDTASDDAALDYQWDFGDGGKASGATPLHMYRHAETNPYTVTLTVTDDNGIPSPSPPASQYVTVTNAAPVAGIALLSTSGETRATLLSALTSSDSLSDAPSLAYTWYFGDGYSGSGSRVMHRYPYQGPFDVVLYATDAHSASGQAMATVTIPNTAPFAFAGPDRRVHGAAIPLHFVGEGVDDDGEPLAYVWDWGDLSLPTPGQDVYHAYAASGAYTVTLTVTDASGSSATDTAWAFVEMDSDGDLLSDECEDLTAPCGLPVATNKNDPDTDHDLILDFWEPETPYGTDPTDDDSDEDGLIDWEEFFVGTDTYVTNPLDADTDDDHLSDGLEDGLISPQGEHTSSPWGSGVDTSTGIGHGPDQDPGTTTDPTRWDSDEDGLPDGWVDCGDGISGCLFSEQEPGYPADPDPDGDDYDYVGNPDGTERNGLLDLYEYEDHDRNGVADPAAWGSGGETDAAYSDTDGDGLADGLEIGLPDDDWLPDEWQEGTPSRDTDPSTTTDPLDRDFDDDGLWDGSEDVSHDGSTYRRETDPTLADTDGDGLTDGQERGLGWPEGYSNLMSWQNDPSPHTSSDFAWDWDPSSTTNPLTSDTDNDGLPDGWVDCGDGGDRCLMSPDEPGYDPGSYPDPHGDDYPAGTEGNGNQDAGEYEDQNLDGLLDSGETNPSAPDSDSDRLMDRGERLDTDTNPRMVDTDADGLPDEWEVRFAGTPGLDPNDPSDATSDDDLDALDALDEYALGTSPLAKDTDEDWIPDDDPDPMIPADPDPVEHSWTVEAGSTLAEVDARVETDLPGTGGVFSILAAADLPSGTLPLDLTVSTSGEGGGNLPAAAILLKFSTAGDYQETGGDYMGATELALKVRYVPANLPTGMRETYLQLYRLVGYDQGAPRWSPVIDDILGETSGVVRSLDFAWAHTFMFGAFALADATQVDVDGDLYWDAEELNLADYDPTYDKICPTTSYTGCYWDAALDAGVGETKTADFYLPVDVTKAAREEVKVGTQSTLIVSPDVMLQSSPELGLAPSGSWTNVLADLDANFHYLGEAQTFMWPREGCVYRVEIPLRRDPNKNLQSVTIMLGGGPGGEYPGGWRRDLSGSEIETDPGGDWEDLTISWPSPPILPYYCPAQGTVFSITVLADGDYGSLQWGATGSYGGGEAHSWKVNKLSGSSSWVTWGWDLSLRLYYRDFPRDVKVNVKAHPGDQDFECWGTWYMVTDCEVQFNSQLDYFLGELSSRSAEGPDPIYEQVDVAVTGLGQVWIHGIHYETDATRADSVDVLPDDCDADGIRDDVEQDVLSVNCGDNDPATPEPSRDTDGDGILDGEEGFGAWSLDVPDADGLINGLDPDSDGDGLWDGWHDTNDNLAWDATEGSGEWNFGTNPWKADHDGDGLLDGWDDDGDGVWLTGEGKGEVGDETQGGDGGYGTNPLIPDTDGDGWDDSEETETFGSDPLSRNPLPYWGITWQVPVTDRGREQGPWLLDDQVYTRSAEALRREPDGTSQMELIWEHYFEPTHARVIRAEVNIFEFDQNVALRTRSANSVANLAIWARARDAYLILNLNLGDGKAYETGLELSYGDAAFEFVSQLANTLLPLDPDAYARILVYQVENEMNHPWHHGGGFIGWGFDKQWTLLNDGSKSIRQAEVSACVANGMPPDCGPVGFRHLMVNYNFDYALIACGGSYGCTYGTMLAYFEAAILPGTPEESPVEIVGLDYYPGSWSGGLTASVREVTENVVNSVAKVVKSLLNDPSRRIYTLVAETGMSTCDPCFNDWFIDTPPFLAESKNTEEEQRDFYRDTTAALSDYYRQGGGEDDGFLGVVWYWMADTTKGEWWNLADMDDWPRPFYGWWAAADSTEWNFGLLETSQPGTWGIGGYGRGEYAKLAWHWLAEELDPAG